MARGGQTRTGRFDWPSGKSRQPAGRLDICPFGQTFASGLKHRIVRIGMSHARGRRWFRRGRHMTIDSIANMNIALESTMKAARSPTLISKLFKGHSQPKLKPVF
jgi:hypothetical protein